MGQGIPPELVSYPRLVLQSLARPWLSFWTGVAEGSWESSQAGDPTP